MMMIVMNCFALKTLIICLQHGLVFFISNLGFVSIWIRLDDLALSWK